MIGPDHSATTSVDVFTKDFNEILMNKLFIFINEAPEFTTKPKLVENMKTYITDPIISINGKNKPEINVENRSNYICISNES